MRDYWLTGLSSRQFVPLKETKWLFHHSEADKMTLSGYIRGYDDFV